MSNEYKDWIKDKNYELCQRYPFLIPRNLRTDEVSDEYDYSRTKLDSMPLGWNIAFGEIMCEEIRDELIRVNYLNHYRILDIKEKYGSLRWYDAGAPKDSNIHDIIMKWEHISNYVCQTCGSTKNVMNTAGYWIESICKDCAKKREEKIVQKIELEPLGGDPNKLRIECYDPIKGEYERIIDCSNSWKKVVENDN